MSTRSRLALSLVAAVAFVAVAPAKDLTSSLKKGTPDIKGISAMAFGPEGVLFVGDPKTGSVFAIGTGDVKPDADAKAPKIDNVKESLASLLGIESKQIEVKDVAVNPASKKVYLGVTRGTGADAMPAIVRIDAGNKPVVVELKDVPFAKTVLPNAKLGDQRTEAITCMSYVDGRLIVASLSNEDFNSNLRSIPFPFEEKADTGAGIKIYHGAHGKFETNSPVRTFAAYDLGGQAQILAAYQCTPLVRIPVGELKAGAKVTGTTIAELGAGNRPLDMIVYKKDGKDYLLIANTTRGIMKVPTEGIDKAAGIETKVPGRETAGVKYEKIESLTGVVQLAKFDDKTAVVLTTGTGGTQTLKTVDLP